MFVLVYRVRTHIRLGIWQQAFVFMFVLMNMVEFVATGCCAYVLVVVDGMNAFNTSHFGNKHFCLSFFCCRGYSHM